MTQVRRAAGPTGTSTGTVSLRWVFVHPVEEHARHNGHADLLCERIDGAIGLWAHTRAYAVADTP